MKVVKVKKQNFFSKLMMHVVANPVVITFFGGGVGLVLFVLGCFIYEVNKIFELTLPIFLWTWFGCVLVSIFFSLGFKDCFVLYFGEGESSSGKMFLKVTDGIVVQAGKTLWKNKVSDFFIITNLPWYSDKITSHTDILLKYGNVQAEIPVMITVSLDSGFDWQEVYKKSIVEYDETDLKEFIAKVFQSVIKGHQETFKSFYESYSRGEISEVQLFDKILNKIEFPSRLLKNVSGVTINLDTLSVVGCKGTACKKA